MSESRKLTAREQKALVNHHTQANCAVAIPRNPLSTGGTEFGRRVAERAANPHAKPKHRFIVEREWTVRTVENITWEITGHSTPEQILAMLNSGTAFLYQIDADCNELQVRLKKTNEVLAVSVHVEREQEALSNKPAKIKNRRV